MNIRDATRNDLPKILELNQASVPQVGDVGMEQMEYFLNKAKNFWVIEGDDEIAGFMVVLQPGLDYSSMNYSFFCNNYSDFDYVDRIVVAEDFRGKKIGTALYKKLFDDSDKAIVTCEVNIKPPNPDSIAFHVSLGFKKVAEMRVNHGEKEVALLIKNLK